MIVLKSAKKVKYFDSGELVRNHLRNHLTSIQFFHHEFDVCTEIFKTLVKIFAQTWSKYQDTPPPNLNDFATSLKLNKLYMLQLYFFRYEVPERHSDDTINVPVYLREKK